MMRTQRTALSLSVFLFLTFLPGCASVSSSPEDTIPSAIAMALEISPPDLFKSADSDEAYAQLAASIVLTFGLNGVRIDPAAAAKYRELALRVRGYTDTSIYVPGYANVSGQTRRVKLPNVGISIAELKASDRCVSLISGSHSMQSAEVVVRRGVCGGPNNYRRLSKKWADASSKH